MNKTKHHLIVIFLIILFAILFSNGMFYILKNLDKNKVSEILNKNNISEFFNREKVLEVSLKKYEILYENSKKLDIYGIQESCIFKENLEKYMLDGMLNKKEYNQLDIDLKNCLKEFYIEKLNP